MIALVFVLGIAFVATSVFTPLARCLALRWGLVDKPDARRKIHTRPIPVAGGIVVMMSTCLVVGGALLVPNSLQEFLAESGSLLASLFFAASLLCVLGVLDDYRCLRGRHKLLGQLAAVSIVILFNVRIENIALFGWELELGTWAIPFTMFWLLGTINSLNLIDGMDGLLSSLGAVISAAMALMAILGGHWAAACIAMALTGSLLGFLRYNLPPATIFLGDAGSMVIGLAIGVLGIQSSLKAPVTIALIAPLAILTIPILDTAAAVIRRKLTGRSIYTTDRSHLHHCLLRRGYSTWVSLVLISSFCLLTGIGALASVALKNELVAVVTILAVITILVTTRLFGHSELVLIKNRLMQALLSFLPGAKKESYHTEMRLQGTTAWNGLVHVVTAPDLDLNLHSVSLDVNAPALHEEYHAHWDRSEKPIEAAGVSLWYADLPLTINGQVIGRFKVVGVSELEFIAAKISTLTRLIAEFNAGLDESTSQVIGIRASTFTSAAEEVADELLSVARVVPSYNQHWK